MQSRHCRTHLAGGLFAALLIMQGSTLAQQAPEDPLALGPRTDEFPVKYAIYSAAWSMSTNEGLRIVVHNRGNEDVILQSVVFQNNSGDGDETELDIGLEIPAGAWAETEKPYLDLLSGNSCVEETLQDDWRLKEISNYTLNPSVRGLIIEDTRSFRIFQCVREVRLSWEDGQNDEQTERQWVMYHFERLPFD